jgi:hypothetical protein
LQYLPIEINNLKFDILNTSNTLNFVKSDSN